MTKEEFEEYLQANNIVNEALLQVSFFQLVAYQEVVDKLAEYEGGNIETLRHVYENAVENVEKQIVEQKELADGFAKVRF